MIQEEEAETAAKGAEHGEGGEEPAAAEQPENVGGDWRVLEVEDIINESVCRCCSDTAGSAVAPFVVVVVVPTSPSLLMFLSVRLW